MKLKGISYVYMVIMVLMMVVIVASIRMPYFQPKILPLIISSCVFVLAGIGLIRGTKDKPAAGIAEGEAVEEDAKAGWSGYLVYGAWVAGLYLAILLFGFLIAIPVFLFAYTKSHGGSWLSVIICTIAVPVFIYGIFEFALGLDLYRGLIAASLGS